MVVVVIVVVVVVVVVAAAVAAVEAGVLVVVLVSFLTEVECAFGALVWWSISGMLAAIGVYISLAREKQCLHYFVACTWGSSEIFVPSAF